MQRNISARVEESTVDLINRIAREKKLTKKRIIEEAIKHFWQEIDTEKGPGLFQTSFGAWKRDESSKKTVRRAREAFNKSML